MVASNAKGSDGSRAGASAGDVLAVALAHSAEDVREDAGVAPDCVVRSGLRARAKGDTMFALPQARDTNRHFCGVFPAPSRPVLVS